MSEEKNESYAVVEVPETTNEMIRTPDGRILSDSFALVEILNELKDIKKALK